MEIDEIGSDIWDKLSHGERLSKDQEKLVIAHIKIGDFNDTKSIVVRLRTNSQLLQEKSEEEMIKVIDSLKVFMLVDANQHLETAIVAEWQGAATNAQANRIDNTMAQEVARQTQIAEQQAAARELARQSMRAGTNLPPPIQLPPMPSNAAIQGARTALNPPPPIRMPNF